MIIRKRSFCLWRTNRKGSVLILVFWALCFLSVLAISMGYAVRQKLMFMTRLSERSQLYWVAEAGVRAGEAEIRKLVGDPNVNSLKDDWAHAETRFDRVRVGEGIFSLKIVDEERKINLNTADVSVLKSLFLEVLGVGDAQAEELASAIVDWRDQDNSPLPMGAENNFYTGLQHSYECKNAPFQISDELLLVRGVTVTIYDQIKDYVTIYGDGIVNINTTSLEALVALGLEKKMAEKVVVFRAGKDGVSGTVDDVVFSDSASVSAQMNQAESLSLEEAARLGQWFGTVRLGVKSQFFSVYSQGAYDQKKGVLDVMGVFKRIPLENGGWGSEIQYWRIR